jgi:F-type H+-transporting ATPase subunit b
MMNISLGGVLIQMISTLILFGALTYFFFKPVKAQIDAREQKIRQNIENAENLKKEAHELKESYEQRISLAKEEGQQILRNATKRGEDRKEEIVKQAEGEAKKMLERANLEISRSKQKALADLRGEIVEIALMATTRVVETSVDEKGHRNLINQFIEEVGEV